MIKNNIDLLQRIQLSLFVFVLGAILYYFVTMLAPVGISPIQLSTAITTSNTTSDEVTFYNNKGMSLNGIGKFNESITYFDKALAIDPKNVDALTGKGNVLSNLGNNTGSVAYYDKALAIDPKNVDALTGKQQSLTDK